MAEGILTLNPMMPVKQLDQQTLIDPALGAGIGLALVNMLKDKNKENLPEEIKEEKTPQQEPPEGEPDLLRELTKQTAEEVIRKEIKEKQQPINKIQTWGKYFDSKDEAEQVAKENNITLRDLEIPALKKQITFKKTGDGFDIYFDKKLIGELQDITFLKQEDNTQIGNQRTFNLSLINKDGFMGEAYDTLEGIKFAKEVAKSDIAKDLLRDTTEPGYPSLKNIFQNLEYNKKGQPKAAAEKVEKVQKEIAELKRNKKSTGGMIDNPLPGGSRFI